MICDLSAPVVFAKVFALVPAVGKGQQIKHRVGQLCAADFKIFSNKKRNSVHHSDVQFDSDSLGVRWVFVIFLGHFKMAA